jgi:thiosulfate dehydrogenase [quinone] large subunit
VSAARHNLALANGSVLPDGSVRFHAYLNGGTPAAPSNIMAATLLNQDGSVLEQWDGTALSHLPPSAIARLFGYKSCASSSFGRRAEIGGRAGSTLVPVWRLLSFRAATLRCAPMAIASAGAPETN